jgi:hypothetical protein
MTSTPAPPDKRFAFRHARIRGLGASRPDWFLHCPARNLLSGIASSLKKRVPGYTKMGFPDPRKMLG